MLTKMVDGSWIDLRQVQSVEPIKSVVEVVDGAGGYIKGPLVQIKFENTSRVHLLLEKDSQVDSAVDELATKINAERSPALVDQVHTLTWALHEIRDHLSAIESNNPNVKERVNGCINIARKALKEET